MKFVDSARRAARLAMDWRIFAIWLIASSVPTLLVAWPLGALIGDTLNFSAHTEALARRLSLAAVFEALDRYQASKSAVQANVGIAWIATLLLIPWLNAIACERYSNSAGGSFMSLVGAGIRDYWRWLWLHLSGLVLMIVTAAFALICFGLMQDRISQLVDAQEAMRVQVAFALFAVFVVLACQFWSEAARAEYLNDAQLAFPPEAYFRALRRGFWWSRLGCFLGFWLIAIVIVLSLNLFRWRFAGAIGPVGAVIGAFLVSVFSVTTMAWARLSRLYALAFLATPR